MVLIMDEMHIREDLVYDKHTGIYVRISKQPIVYNILSLGGVVGFVNIGDNNHLVEYEKTVTEDEGKEEIAKSMMVIMVRGLFSKLKFPYAQFPCSSICGYHLYDIFWEAVERLERCGLRVVACTCDGLAANRTFFKLHGDERQMYKALNPYSEDKRYIFFFSDPPHLMKTTRNCWSSTKRLLWVQLLFFCK